MADTDFWSILTIIAQRYPQYAPLLQKPGVFDVLTKAIQENWSADRIFAGLQNTDYFKSTSDTQRQWDILSATNPGTAREKVRLAGETAARVALQLGVPVDQNQLLWLGVAAATNDWDENRIRAQIVANTNSKDQTGAGAIGDQIHQYQGLASQYAVPIDDQALYWWAANTLGGSVTQEGFRDYLTEQAINLYPALKSPLEQGMSVAQYAAPYLSTAANELGINPNSISLSDPKWTDTFIGANDKGEQRVLSMQESLSKIRTDAKYGYDQGTPGVTQAANFAQQLGQLMGAVGA